MYPIFIFKLKKPHNNLYKYIVDRLRPIIDNNKSTFRLRQINNNYYEYSNDSTDEIIKYTFISTNNIKNINKRDVVSRTMKNDNKILFYISNNSYLICSSHLFRDGIGTLKLIISYINDDKYNFPMPTYYYIPIYNEISFIYSGIKTLIKGMPKQHMSLDYPQETSHNCTMVKTKLDIMIFKQFKKYVSNKLKKKISFSCVFAALQFMIMFSVTNLNELTFGLVVAFNNDNRFNNFAAFPISISRKNEYIQNNSDNEFLSSLTKLCNFIDIQINNNKHMISLYYSLTNIYNISFPINKSIDVLISGIPLCVKKQHSIDGIEIQSVDATMPYHTSPVYLLYLSDTKHIFINTHIRTKDVNVKLLRNFYKNKLFFDNKIKQMV